MTGQISIGGYAAPSGSSSFGTAVGYDAVAGQGGADRRLAGSHGTDQREFYQLLTYKDDVDLNAKLAEWEAFYNYHRPHGSLGGQMMCPR